MEKRTACYTPVCLVCDALASDGETTLFSFPKRVNNPLLRKEWCEIVGIEESKLRYNMKICQRHFEKSQIPRYLLKRGAKPSKRLVDAAMKKKAKTEEKKEQPKKELALAPKQGSRAYFEPIIQIGRISYAQEGVSIPTPVPVSIVPSTSLLQSLEQLLPGAVIPSGKVHPAPSGFPGTIIPLGTLPLTLSAASDNQVMTYTMPNIKSESEGNAEPKDSTIQLPTFPSELQDNPDIKPLAVPTISSVFSLNPHPTKAPDKGNLCQDDDDTEEENLIEPFLVKQEEVQVDSGFGIEMDPLAD